MDVDLISSFSELTAFMACTELQVAEEDVSDPSLDFHHDHAARIRPLDGHVVRTLDARVLLMRGVKHAMI